MFQFPTIFNTPTVFIIHERRDEMTNVKMLLAAVIRRAAFDIALYRNDKRLVNRRIAMQAARWMFEDDLVGKSREDRFISFLNVCEILNQDPNVIRRKTLALQAGDVRKFDRVGKW